ncbi:two-component sensor histidine kinase [alpha proteobacterium U9-1i]|nr:two-component sensor histidine kinase [alpha proteobacterium U9-1i]
MSVPAKWRPSLWMITAALIASAILLPLSGLVFFRIYENQLIRQTEGELIGQAAVLAAAYQREIALAGPEVFPVGAPRPPEIVIDPEGRYAPIVPALDLASSPILPSRPDARFAPIVHPNAVRLGETFEQIALAAQRTTLAGFRFLDANGVVVAGRAETGGSLAHVPEVREALAGRFSATLRLRIRDAPPPPIYSISRGAKIRVFVAMPVFVDDHVRGVVYLSRTPDNIVRNMYAERVRLLQAALLILVASALIGVLFMRAVARPARGLLGRANAIARGDRAAIGPLPQHGTREIADLTQGFMDMARRLFDRSDYLSAFATHVSHELKTPLASIKGATELMLDNVDMSATERERFLRNVLADTERMSALLSRLRDLARAENPELGGTARVSEVVHHLKRDQPAMEITLEGDAVIAMSTDNALIVFGHLADNARRHGARRLSVEATGGEVVRVRLSDDGEGISPANRPLVFEPFFTTRRAAGGTGMGLGIVRALMRAHGGDVTLVEASTGAAFVLTFPARV